MSPLLSVVYTYTRGGEGTRAYAATASTLNFQARLQKANGSLVADGSYSIQFKLYTAVTGGTNEWTETQTITARNGYISANLGAVTPFGASIDWSQEKWLTMNINADGEMNPRIKLTGVPYAFRSGLADLLSITGGTISGDNLLQKAPTSVQSLSSANSGLRFNQTGAGGLIQLQGDGLDVFTVSKSGLVTANGLNNNSVGITNAGSITGIGANLTGTGALTLASGGAGDLTLTSASNTIILGGTTSTLKRSGSGLTVDVANAGTSTFTLTNSDASNVLNLSVEGGITAGIGSAFNVNTNGDITSTSQVLNGTSTASGGSGLGTSTSLTLASAANFDVGNYVQVNSTNCGGTGVSVCYAKITAKSTNTLTITPALSWANGATVNEYDIPEIGGTGATSTLANRYGRGYFIAGVATGNGTTYYNEDSIETNKTSFDLLNTNVTTLNFGGAATTLNIGSASTNVNILGSLSTAASQTITAGGGLVVSSGGINNNNGGITNTGALAGVTSITASGSITAATSNTINGLSISSGSLSGITGFSQTSGNFSVTGTGSITLGAGSNALTIDSTNFDVSSAGALSGITTISMSGGITAATSNTINGLSISSGSLSGISGFSQSSGNFAISGSGTFDTGTGAINLNGATTISGTNTLTVSGGLTSLGAGLSVTGDASISRRTYVPGISGASAEGYFTGSAATPLTSYQGYSLGSVTYSILGTNKSFNGSAWVDNGLARTGSSLQIQNDALNFYSFNTGTTSTQRFTIASGGNVGIGISTTTPGALLSVGGTTGNFQVSSTGVITTTTSSTINGLSISSGSLSGVTGFGQTSGNFSATGTGSITLGAGSNALTIDSTAFDVTSTGAVSGVTTLGLSGAITGATTGNTINGLIINSGALTGVTGITFSSGNLAMGGGSITGVGANITGNGALTITSGATTALTLDSGTTGPVNLGTSNNAKTLNIATGTAGDTINLATDNTVTDILNIGSANDTLTITSSAFKLTSAGAISGLTTLSLSGAITGATATNTINGLIINSGSLSGITGFTQTSGNFAMSGTGTFGTGTGAVSLNGATSVTGTNTFTVGTGTTTLGGALNANGLSTFSGGVTIQTGDTLTFNAEAFTDLTGQGLILSAGALTIDVATAGTVAGTSSNSGLITAADGLSLLRGCSNGQLLKWNGTAWACSADNTGLSDARLKENVQSIGSVLDDIKNLNVVNFNFKCMDPTLTDFRFTCDQQTGIIAQDLAAVFPGLVKLNEQGYNQVDFGALNFYTLKAVTELAQKIDGSGNATLNTVSTNGVLRLDGNGVLQNINGLYMTSGGASIAGGLNNNGGGITSAGFLAGVTSISAQSISLTATGNQNLLTLTKDGNNVFTVFNSGALQLQLDSPEALAIKAANGDNALGVDTLTGKIRVGSGNNAKTFLFVLDSKSTEGDPEGTNGAQYYNSESNKFRCYQNNEWQDCVQSSYSEYTLMSVPGPWTAQPSADTEFPVQNRTWIQLRNSNQFRIVANLNTGGAGGATCRIQYATNTNSTTPDWHDLSSDATKGALSINTAGALKTDWVPVAKEGKNDSLLRVMCKGGDGQMSPNFSSIRIQVR